MYMNLYIYITANVMGVYGDTKKARYFMVFFFAVLTQSCTIVEPDSFNFIGTVQLNVC